MKKTKTLIQKDICTSMFIAALFTIAKIWKEFKFPIGKEFVVFIYVGILAIQNEIMPLATNGLI